MLCPGTTVQLHRPTREPGAHETARHPTGRSPPPSVASLRLWICPSSPFCQTNAITPQLHGVPLRPSTRRAKHGTAARSKNVPALCDSLCEQRQPRRRTDTCAMITRCAHTFKTTSVAVQHRQPQTLSYTVSLRKNATALQIPLPAPPHWATLLTPQGVILGGPWMQPHGSTRPIWGCFDRIF